MVKVHHILDGNVFMNLTTVYKIHPPVKRKSQIALSPRVSAFLPEANLLAPCTLLKSEFHKEN